MADIRDVMAAQGVADNARERAAAHRREFVDDSAIILAAEAICAEIRALSIRLDYLTHATRRS